jgi:SAM-dependent methyltransferase
MLSRSQEIDKHPERFDPEEDSGKLIDAEHRARYHWAAQVAASKRVLDAGCGLGYGTEILSSAGAAEVIGIDLNAEAVEEARRRINGAGTVQQGDVQGLEFGDQSFDLVVCFETIEHVEEAPSALAEFHRVLRPGGVLLLSSPNPDAYPPGNEHHVREYKPGELVDLVCEHFSNVEYHRQAALLASGIELGNGGSHGQNGDAPQTTRLQTRELESGREQFGLIAASDAEVPHLDRFLALAPPFEVRWWSEQVAAAHAEADEARAESEKAIEAAREDALATVTSIEERARRQLAEKSDELEAAKSSAAAAEQQAAERIQALERESQKLLAQAQAQARLVEERLQETSRSLLESNQELAQVPLLKHRLAELHEEHAHLWGRFNELEGSRSWRLTSPLRGFRAYFRFRG